MAKSLFVALTVSLMCSGAASAQRHISAIKTHANGGTFEAFLPVKPILTFTRVDAPEPNVVVEPDPIHLLPEGDGLVPWVYDPPISVLEISGVTSNFFAGVASDGTLEGMVAAVASFALSMPC